MSVLSFASIPKNGDFLISSSKPIFIRFPIVSNYFVKTELEGFLNCFVSSTLTDSSILNKECSLLCATSFSQSQCKAKKTCILGFLFLSLFKANNCHI